MIVFGSRLYGQIDYIPERNIYIATECTHIYYLPLFPTRGWIVTGEQSDGWQGKPISIYFRSVMAAWFRTILVGIIVSAACLAIAMWDQPVTLAGFVATAIVFIALNLASYRYGPFGSADSDGRARIEQELGLETGALAEIDPYAQWYAAGTRSPEEHWKSRTDDR